MLIVLLFDGIFHCNIFNDAGKKRILKNVKLFAFQIQTDFQEKNKIYI